jgi:hypothetical protein
MDVQQLGGSIDLVGFRDIDGGSMIVVKKIVGNYTKKFTTRLENFERIIITMKPVHKVDETKSQYELHGRLLHSGKTENAELTDHNLFFALDKVLKSLEKRTS